MNELPKPVRARPVVSAPPPPPTPPQPTQKPVTIETLAYELREIRLFLEGKAKRSRQTGLMFIFVGLGMGGAGLLFTPAFLGTLLLVAGVVLFVVGIGM